MATATADPPTTVMPLREPTDTCNARIPKRKKYCGQVAGWGTDHEGFGRCKLHGGAEPNAQINGVVELARREARVMGTPLDVEPRTAILECIKIAWGEVDYATDQVAKLREQDALVRPLSGDSRPLKMERGAEDPEVTVQETHLASEELNKWIQVRHECMDRAVKYSAAAVRAGVEERAVEIAEKQGQQIVAVIRGVLSELGVANKPGVEKIVRKQLTMVAGQG